MMSVKMQKSKAGNVRLKDDESIHKTQRLIESFIIVAISLLLLIAPFYRGMFFRENIMPFIAGISGVFIILAVYRLWSRQVNMELGLIDIGLMGLTIAYFLPFLFGSVSKMNSFDGVLKLAAAFMFYMVVKAVVREGKGSDIFVNVILISGFTVALVSMLGSAGIIKTIEVFGFGDRLMGFYQYPNSTASVLGAIYLFTVILLIDSKNRYVKVLYTISAATVMLAFLETKSRGGMLIFAAAWLLTLLILNGRQKLMLIIYSAVTTLSALLLYQGAFDSFMSHKGFLGLYLILIAVNAILGFIIGFVEKYVKDVGDKAVNLALTGIVGVFIIIVVVVLNATVPLNIAPNGTSRDYEIYSVKPNSQYIAEVAINGQGEADHKVIAVVKSVDKAKERNELYNGMVVSGQKDNGVFGFRTADNTQYVTVTFINGSVQPLDIGSFIVKDKQTGAVVEKLKLKYKFLPDDIGKRISEISLKTENSSERMVFVKDGIKMFKDYMLFGTGAKGWGMLYTKYQAYGYVSKEAHNFYLQTAIESGLLGVLSLIVLVGGFVAISVKLYLKNRQSSLMLTGATIAAIMLLGHAVIDFDMSCYAIFILLCAFLAIISNHASRNLVMIIKFKNRPYIQYASILIAAVVLIFSSMIYFGIHDGIKAAKLTKTDINSAKPMYIKAMDKDIYNASYLADYAQIITIEAEKNQNKELINEAHEKYRKIEELDPYEAKYYPIMIEFYLKHGYLADAKALADRLVDLQPLSSQSYEVKAAVNYSIVSFYINIKDYANAKTSVDKILEIENEYKRTIDRAIVPFEMTDKTKGILKAAKDIQKHLS